MEGVCPQRHGNEMAHRYQWEVDPALPAGCLEGLFEAFPDLQRLRGVSILKTNHFRTVFRAPAELLDPTVGGRRDQALQERAPAGVVAKVYRYTGRWDRFRYRFIPHRARQEWRALKLFQEAGLPTARPLAVAEARDGEDIVGGGLILGFLPDSEPLVERLHALFSLDSGAKPRDAPRDTPRDADGRSVPAEARELLLRAGKLVRRMHDQGAWHRDLHSSNILVSKKDGSLSLIDLHSCLFFKRLARWQRRRTVVKLLHSLRGTVPGEGMRILLEAYGGESLFRKGLLSSVEERLLERVEALDRKRLRSRSKRCFLPSTLFTVERERGARVYHLRDWPGDELEALWRPEPPPECIKTSRRGWLASRAVGGRRVCVKYCRYTLRESLQSLIESHRLRRAYGGGHALKVRHIPTPQVVALREERALGLVREAYLVTDLVEDGVALDKFLLKEYWQKRPSPAASRRKRLLAREAGRLLRSIHDRRLSLHDLSPQNLVVSAQALAKAAGGSLPERPARGEVDGRSEGGTAVDPFLFLVDLDHLYLWKPLLERCRMRNLIQVANLPEGHVSAADRWRGLLAYARGEERFLERRSVERLRAGILREHLKTIHAR
jgi:tRNA A-37 threonylcarbamoyl transferase component Bud32